MSIVVRYGGTPQPIHSHWGEVGFEELSNGVLVAVNPTVPHRGFPATTIPARKPATASRSAPTVRIAQSPTASWCPAGRGPE